MDCLNSIAPTDEELISLALDEEALPEEANNHLQQCETCQQRLARYKQVNTYLLSHLYRSQCPSGQELSLYCADLLPADERMRIANHVKECPLCTTEVTETRKFLRTLDIELPVSSWSPRALLRPIFATRVIRTQPQFAVRGNSFEAAWPRQYKAESVDLSLHLSLTSKGEHMLLGILTSIDPAESVDALEGVPAELNIAPWPLHQRPEILSNITGREAASDQQIKGGSIFPNTAVTTNGDKPGALPLLRTQVDDLGHIVFKPVPAGEYVMVIYLPNRELIIEDLVIE